MAPNFGFQDLHAPHNLVVYPAGMDGGNRSIDLCLPIG